LKLFSLQTLIRLRYHQQPCLPAGGQAGGM